MPVDDLDTWIYSSIENSEACRGCIVMLFVLNVYVSVSYGEKTSLLYCDITWF